MDDLNKLPEWAQSKISVLQNTVKDLDDQLKRVTSGESPITWSVGIRDDKHGIPERAEIEFRVRGGTVSTKLRDGRLEIHGIGGLISLDIKPEASNAISVGLYDRKKN